MKVCRRCNSPIEFRYINGHCIPMHISGGCTSFERKCNDYSGDRRSDESECFSTNCPECGDEVFFVRHNGGSVWLDSPLGWPWYKHGCFEIESNGEKSVKEALISSEEIEKINKEHSGSSLDIGVVKTTSVEPNKNYTDILFVTGEMNAIRLRIAYNAGYLLGKLSVLDKENSKIWLFYEPEIVFVLHDPQMHVYTISRGKDLRPEAIKLRAKAKAKKRAKKIEEKENKIDEMALKLVERLVVNFSLDKYVAYEIIRIYGINRLRKVAQNYTATLEENFKSFTPDMPKNTEAVAKIRKAKKSIIKAQSKRETIKFSV